MRVAVNEKYSTSFLRLPMALQQRQPMVTKGPPVAEHIESLLSDMDRTLLMARGAATMGLSTREERAKEVCALMVSLRMQADEAIKMCTPKKN